LKKFEGLDGSEIISKKHKRKDKVIKFPFFYVKNADKSDFRKNPKIDQN